MASSEARAAMLKALKETLGRERWAALVAEVHALRLREYRSGNTDGYIAGSKCVPVPPRPVISDEALRALRGTLRTLRGTLRSNTMRIGALIIAAAGLLMDESTRTEVVALFGPRALPIMGVIAGLAMIIQRARTTQSIAERGESRELAP